MKTILVASYETISPTPEPVRFCGVLFMSWGHNAQPINDGRCCDECNATVVIPKRIPPTSQRTLKHLRSVGISRGIPLDDLTDERLEQRIAARREWTNGIVRDVIAKRVAKLAAGPQ